MTANMWTARTWRSLYEELGVPQMRVYSTEFDIITEHIFSTYFKDASFEPVSEQKDITHHFRTLLNMEKRTNQVVTVQPTPNDIWVFGYGALIWMAEFPYIDRKRGYIRGYQRRFYQHCIDHRGTPKRPGRVVTLVATGDPDDRVYGVAYRVAASDAQHVIEHLDSNEKSGYERKSIKCHEYPDGESFRVAIYIASKENPCYAGKSPYSCRLVDEIITSAGPSGSNREYLFNLAEAMRALFPDVIDEYLFDLEKAVRERIDEDEEDAYDRALKNEINVILRAATKQNTPASVAEAVRRFDNLRNWCEKPGSRESLLAKVFQADYEESSTHEAVNV